jgi:tetratricopeptide (TPR) repeat protein
MPDLKHDKEFSRRWEEVLAADDSPAARIELCERFVRDFSSFGPGWVRYGRELIGVSRFDDAEVAIRRGLDLAPSGKRLYLYCDMGEIFKYRGGVDTAVQWFQRAIAEFPDDAQGYIYLGGMLARRGQLEEAERVHRRGTLCTTGCVDEAYLNLGFVLRAQRRYAEAVECFDEAIRRDPRYEEAIAARADCERTLRLVRSLEAEKDPAGA